MEVRHQYLVGTSKCITFISTGNVPCALLPRRCLPTYPTKERGLVILGYICLESHWVLSPLDWKINSEVFFEEGDNTGGMWDLRIIPWGFLHLLWLHTASAGQTLRVSWSGPALSSVADGPASWRRHQPQLRSRARSSLPAASPFKKEKFQMHHISSGLLLERLPG